MGVKGAVADVLDGGVLDDQMLDAERTEGVAVQTLNVAVADLQGVDEGADLLEAHGEGGQVGVGALDVEALLGSAGAIAGVQGAVGAHVARGRVHPLAQAQRQHKQQQGGLQHG